MTSSRARWGTKIATIAAGLAAALLAPAPDVLAENWLHQLRGGKEEAGTATTMAGLAGARLLDGGDWSPVDTQPLIGLDVTHVPEGWWAGWCAALLVSAASGTASDADVTARIVELQAGGRKVWTPGRTLRPYAGGGASLLGLSYAIDGGPHDDSDMVFGLGLWLGAGATLRLGDAWRIGVDARYSNVNVEVAGTRRNAGGIQAGLVAGYRWSDW